MRLKGLDLNLLVALDILLEERSVTRAARRLHLSQPAASAALGRLREYFQDDLLVMHGKRLMPTSFAENLLPELKRVTRHIDDLVAMSTEFEPARSERLFRFMASDYIVTVLMTQVLKVLATEAPGVRLDMRLPEDSVYRVFERGEIDLMLIPEEFLLPGHPATRVLEEPCVVVAWKDNPLFNRKISTAKFFDAAHVAVTLGPKRDPSFTERNMEKLGHTRRIDVYAPHFSAVPWLLLDTPRIAVMQERLARKFAQVLPLKMAPMPFDFPVMRIMAQYHEARERDQGLKWFIQVLKSCARDTATRRRK
jgi:LysR family nod box-dependent transcriptional activator